MAAVAIVTMVSLAQSTDYKTGPAPGIQWSKTYNLQGYGWADDLSPTSDGGFIITGMTYDGDLDAFLLKTSADGDLQWKSTFGGPDDDEGLSVVQTPDGGYVMAGISMSLTNMRISTWSKRTEAAKSNGPGHTAPAGRTGATR
jgi:hypothetical protein